MASGGILRRSDHEKGELEVDASPSKQFFIGMLVKDISLGASILDLVDNSVDGARATRLDGKFDGLHIKLQFDSKSFHITDNCGGMEASTARDYAFRFGRSADFQAVSGSVGQFGIGMKRSLFKIGQHFEIASTAPNSKWALEVDVPTWASSDDDEWAFKFSSLDKEKYDDPEEHGVSIHITKLNPPADIDFGENKFAGSMRTAVKLRHEDAIRRGLRISINGDLINPSPQHLLESDVLKPIKRTLVLGEPPGEVQLKVIAGIAPGKDQANRDDGNGEAFTEPADAGWYVYCNDRLLLSADKSALTGWGNGAAVYHPQYSSFRGYLFLSAEDSSLLPWNTTKTGVDEGSPIFRAAQQEMIKALASVLTALNRAKKERRRDNNDPKPLVTALSEAEPVAVQDVVGSESIELPPEEPAAPSNTKKISYEADAGEFDEVQAYLGDDATAPEVGRRTFNYFYENEVKG